MRILISPAKKMIVDTDSLAYHRLPQFLPETAALLTQLRKMNEVQLKKLWNCNDTIAKLNFQRMQLMDLEKNLTPAILSYQGIQYQYMAPGVFETTQFAHIQKHLRILSGFYGILNPFDGVTPYRLEMQAKLAMKAAPNLYAFWGNKLASALEAETDWILNLASREYSKAVLPHLSSNTRSISCIFGELAGNKIIEKGTLCKMARGEMVRWLAENNITQPNALKDFDRLDYRFSSEHSITEQLVFLKGGTKHAGSQSKST